MTSDRNRAGRVRAWVPVCVITVLLAGGCGSARGPAAGGGTGAESAGCAITVRGVTQAPGTLAARWLPAGFRLTGGHPTSVTASAAVTYSSSRVRRNPPRVELSFSHHTGPLTPAVGGRATATRVTVAGHAGLLESGPPSPGFSGVYWSPHRGYLVSVVGYQVPAATVLKVARDVEFTPPPVVSLPVAPGHVVSSAAATAAARRAAHVPGPEKAMAKLTSWTEAADLMQAGGQQVPSPVPAGVRAAPWRPVWAVLLTGSRASGAAGSAGAARLVIVGAASGRPEGTMAVARTHWFSALTDRDPALAGCAGGSVAGVPFGVLTRDEQAYRVAGRQHTGAGGATRSVVLKLTTVAVVNRADPSMYGGCLEQNCSLPQLVWLTVTTVRAAPGKTLACLPPSASYPPGYRPARVRQYVTVTVPGNGEISCHAVPAWVRSVKDLAPPAGRQG